MEGRASGGSEGGRCDSEDRGSAAGGGAAFKEVAAKEMQSSETPLPGEELSRAFHVSSTKKEISVFITAAAPVLRACDIRCGLNEYF